MDSMKKLTVSAFGAVLLALGLALAAGAQAADDGLGATIKEDAKSAGHAIAETSRVVGHSIANASRKVGHTVADDSKKAGHAIADTSKKVGKDISSGAHSAVAGDEPKPKS
jgi:hypothetical protein